MAAGDKTPLKVEDELVELTMTNNFYQALCEFVKILQMYYSEEELEEKTFKELITIYKDLQVN